MSEGNITFSFDCEGKWGMTDIPTPWDTELTRDNMMKTYEFILDTLKNYDICATFAFVGALTDTREEFFEIAYPNLSSKKYSRWLNYSLNRILDKSEEGWFLPELLNIVKERQTHEIATHGYTHIPFDMLDDADKKIELNLIQNWAKKNKLNCLTMVFPRNIIKHQNILKDYGILGYRDLPSSLINIWTPSIIKTFIQEGWIFQNSEELKQGTPLKIPGGSFVNWRRGFRYFIPPFVSLAKYKNILKNAGQKNQIAHFWLHPHNLITSSSTRKLFEKLCAEVAKYRDRYNLVVKRQVDYLT